MPDWTEYLRPRLASLGLIASREAEIIEELSQHLDQRYEELHAGGPATSRRVVSRSRSCGRPTRLHSTCDRFVRRTSYHPSLRERRVATGSAISGRICATPRACCGSSQASRPPPS
jgi:hypothetical protein